MIHPDSQAKMAQRMGATTHSRAVSHASIISQPQEVADFIERAAGHFQSRFELSGAPGWVLQPKHEDARTYRARAIR
jgi:hypothetical protein